MHVPYQEIFKHPSDFRVAYRLYTREGGRYAAAFQGIRWDFKYADKWPSGNGSFMIYPEFEDAGRYVILDKRNINDEGNTTVPMSGTARMWVLNPELRKLHQQRIQKGTKGYFMEGNTKVAECEVIEITGLLSNPTQASRETRQQ